MRGMNTTHETLVSDLDDDARAAYWRANKAEAIILIGHLSWLHRLSRRFHPALYADTRAHLINQYVTGTAVSTRPDGVACNPGAAERIAAALDRHAPKAAA